jgi:hypothetical protein
VTLVLGILTTYYGTRILEWWKKKKRGTQPYCQTSVTGDIISIEAQIPKTAANLTVVSKLEKTTVPKDS